VPGGGTFGAMESITTSRVTPLREPDLERMPQPPANTEAEQALRASEIRFRAMFENAAVGIGHRHDARRELS